MSFVDLITPVFHVLPRLNFSWPWSLPTHKADENISTILKAFLNDHDMFSRDHPSISPVTEDLKTFMRGEVDHIRGLPAENLDRILQLSASLIEVRLEVHHRIFLQLAYHECTLAEKRHIALYNWYMIYLDDVSSKGDITPYVAFQERFLQNIPQLDPVLDGLASVLRAMFNFYSVFHANSIINITLDFISVTCIEPTIEKLEILNLPPRFPWFLRDRTGVAVGYALLLFPKSRQVDYVACFQAMADMDFWICAGNDLLSYHKESIAGETANYISNRATAEAKSPLVVASDIRRELLDSRKQIYNTLERAAGQDALNIWRSFEYGYITWHMQTKRYRLDEVAL